MLKQNQAAASGRARPRRPTSLADDAGESAAADTEAPDANATIARDDAHRHARSGARRERSTPRARAARRRTMPPTHPIGDAKVSETDEATASAPVDPAFAVWLAERPQIPDALRT
jgi:hypothetical protein